MKGKRKRGELSLLCYCVTLATHTGMHTHTHIHVCTQIHMHAYMHMHTKARVGIHTRAQCTHAYKYTPVWVHMYTRHVHTCTHVHNAHPFAAAGLRPLALWEALWAHTWDDAKGAWVAPFPQYLQLCASTIHTLGTEGQEPGWG